MVLIGTAKRYKNFFSQKLDTWTDSSGKPMNWKCTHTTWREMMDWTWADLRKPFCTCLKKGDSHLKHNSQITYIPWFLFFAPTWGRFSRTYLSYYRLPLGAGALHSLFLYSNTPPPPSSWHTLLLSQNSTCKNTLAIWSKLLFLFTRPMKMEENVPKRRHINFRRQEITQKKKISCFYF